MPWDDLISAANKAEARAKIQESTYLDQQCPKGKKPLKMSLNSRNNQTNKKAPQSKEKGSPQAKQGIEKPKRSKKSKKTRKKKEKPEKEMRVTRKQHFGLRYKCNFYKGQKEWPKLQSTSKKPQPDHLLQL